MTARPAIARRSRCCIVVALSLVFVGCEERAAEDARIPTLDTSVALELGVVEGDPAQEFGLVVNAVKLSDGRIAVADYRSTEVRVFAADGTHIRSIGRQGGGPGELPALTRLWSDSANSLTFGGSTKVVRFDADGEFLDETVLDWSVLPRPPYHAETSWPLHDGVFLVKLMEGSGSGPPQEGIYRPGDVYLVANPGGETLDSVGYFPNVEQLDYTAGGRDLTAVPLFPAHSRIFIGRTGVVLADLAADSVLLYDPRTRARRWVHVPIEPQPVDPAALDAAKEEACEWADTPQRRTDCESGITRLPPQTHYPRMRDIAVDSAGHVWVSTYAEAASDTGAEWLVLDDAGSATARVLLPVEFRPTQIGADYILGITADDLGVQRVVDYRMERAP